MEVEFDDVDLDRLETDADFDAGFSRAIVKAYRKTLQRVRAAVDERDLYASKGLRLEKLKGKRKNEYSMRLNDQMRLIVKFEHQSQLKIVRIHSIENYH